MKVKKLLALITCGIVSVGILGGCVGETKDAKKEEKNEVVMADAKDGKEAKYVFTFIGDGMSQVQLNAARVYLGSMKNEEVKTEDLIVDGFPVLGSATTHDSTSFAPDSASTATALATGVKTHSGVIGLEADKETKPENISEKLKKDGKKIGIVSSVSIDHATPAAFYAHTPSRGNMYDIALQLADSNFDYFGGGGLAQPKGKEEDKEDAFKIIEEKGYTIADTKDEFNAITKETGKVYAINEELQESSAMTYSIDAKEDSLKLDDFVSKGIEVLDNEDGFFMMVESGKIDWAGHANDAMANIEETIAFNDAIKVAVDFYKEHPEDTLIVVTGDHETGGMTIGQATTGYDITFDILGNQKMSYVEFNKIVGEYKEKNKGGNLEDLMPVIKENFGLMKVGDKGSELEENKALVLSDYEYNKLKNAFAQTMIEKDARVKNEENEENKILYGGYEPLTVTLTHIINNKAGVGWASYSHTGVPVPVYAMGQGEELFNGSYDNVDVFKKIVEATGLK